MRFSRNWIAEYTDLPEDDRELRALLSMLGRVVDDASNRADDLILDLEIAPNRPDVMNHVGIAREIAIASSGELREPRAELQEGDTRIDDIASVRIEDEEGCTRFVSRALVDVEVGPSPAWLRERLEAIGLRSINAVVDVTNYVMWELGRPLHAYDLDELAGERLVVRRARNGERLVTLDEIGRELTDADLVIADAETPVGLAGVMGGERTGVEAGATRVLLEGACFDPVTVRRMARRHGMHTDASHRFERGLSHQDLTVAIDRAATLIAELTGGEVCAGRIDAVTRAPEPVRIELRTDRVTRLLGVDVPEERIEAILAALQFDVQAVEGGYRVSVPPRRVDVTREVDLIEEIARFWGYDRLPDTIPTIRQQRAGGSAEVRSERHLRRLCAALGYWEAMTFSFTGEGPQRQFTGDERDMVHLGNPLSEEMSVLRTRLVPGLLEAVAHNLNHGERRVRLFELGRVFTANDGAPKESRHLALVACGPAAPTHHEVPPRPFGHADLKGAVDALARRMGWPRLTWTASAVPGFQEGTSARLRADEFEGRSGRISARTAARFGIDVPVWAAEIDVEPLLPRPRPVRPAQPLPRFPASERDVSLLVPEDVRYADLRREVEAVDDVPLAGVSLIDVYEGDDLPRNRASLTLRLTYRAPDRTLTAEEIEAAHEAVIDRLAERQGAERR